jgi:Trk K+ transport system NAD-binding subunit
MIFNPSGETRIESGDILIAIGKVEALTRLNEMALPKD